MIAYPALPCWAGPHEIAEIAEVCRAPGLRNPESRVLRYGAMPNGVDPDVERLNREYCAAYNAGDLEKLLAFLAEDALTLSPDQAPVRGREAHRKYFQDGLAREAQRNLTLTSIRSYRAADLLYDAGEWRQSGVSASFSGYYLTVYRREPGGWKAAVTTFNLKTNL